jgi:hypothetical protein
MRESPGVENVIQSDAGEDYRVPKKLESRKQLYYNAISFVRGNLDVTLIWASAVPSGSAGWGVFVARDAVAVSNDTYANLVHFDHGSSMVRSRVQETCKTRLRRGISCSSASKGLDQVMKRRWRRRKRRGSGQWKIATSTHRVRNA